jgi:hypothetical protein
MCEASIHVPHRLANAVEQLVVMRLPNLHSHMRGLYPFKESREKLVCCRGETKAILKEVHFEEGVAPGVCNRWEGKRNLKVTLMRRFYQDVVRFSDGLTISITNLKQGTRIDIGIPVKPRKSKGMKAVEAALHEIDVIDLIVPPEPKPDEPVEPAPAEPKPEIVKSNWER